MNVEIVTVRVHRKWKPADKIQNCVEVKWRMSRECEITHKGECPVWLCSETHIMRRRTKENVNSTHIQLFIESSTRKRTQFRNKNNTRQRAFSNVYYSLKRKNNTRRMGPFANDIVCERPTQIHMAFTNCCIHPLITSISLYNHTKHPHSQMTPHPQSTHQFTSRQFCTLSVIARDMT